MDQSSYKPPKIDYGKETITKLLDHDGSTEKTVISYKQGNVILPIRKTLEIKEKVRSRAEQDLAYIRFADELEADKTKLDPGWHIEHSSTSIEKGYWYFVKHYTVLLLEY